jgi:hypothetical protein
MFCSCRSRLDPRGKCRLVPHQLTRRGGCVPGVRPWPGCDGATGRMPAQPPPARRSGDWPCERGAPGPRRRRADPRGRRTLPVPTGPYAPSCGSRAAPVKHQEHETHSEKQGRLGSDDPAHAPAGAESHREVEEPCGHDHGSPQPAPVRPAHRAVVPARFRKRSTSRRTSPGHSRWVKCPQSLRVTRRACGIAPAMCWAMSPGMKS